ncbi:MAG TPA: hypothetical protein VH520_01030 [Streptosporangiaceae bacterium]|jgi:hypothetical protein
MNPTPDATAADNGGNFDPRQAAALLGQTTQQARRQFEPSPPWFLALRGVMALAAYGAIWLSVRGQHPYTHPTALALPGVFAFVVVNLGATVAIAKRATAGVSGRTRLRPGEIAVTAAVWIGVFVVLGALTGAKVSDSITYGLYPACVPLIAAGLTWAAVMAARRNWRPCGTALAVAVVGAVALLAGPAGAWIVVGLGICLVLVGSAAVIALRQRA